MASNVHVASVALVASVILIFLQQLYSILWIARAAPWTSVSFGRDSAIRIKFTPRLTQGPTNATNTVWATTAQVTDDPLFAIAVQSVQQLCDTYACNQHLGVCDPTTLACACNITRGTQRCLGYQNLTNCGCQCPNTTLACQEGPRLCAACGPDEACTSVGCRPVNCSQTVCPNNMTCIDGHCTCHSCSNIYAACGPGAIACTNTAQCAANCTCNAYSALGLDGKCACLSGYAGADCSQCAPCTPVQNATCPGYSIGCTLGPAFPNCTIVECLCPPASDSILCPTCGGKPCPTTLCGAHPSLIAGCTYIIPGGVCTPNCTCQNGATPTGPGGTCVCPAGTEFYAGACYYPMLPTFTPEPNSPFGFSNLARNICYVGTRVSGIDEPTINYGLMDFAHLTLVVEAGAQTNLGSMGQDPALGALYLATVSCGAFFPDPSDVFTAPTFINSIGVDVATGLPSGPLTAALCQTPDCLAGTVLCECGPGGVIDPTTGICSCATCTSSVPYNAATALPANYNGQLRAYEALCAIPTLFDDNMMGCAATFVSNAVDVSLFPGGCKVHE